MDSDERELPATPELEEAGEGGTDEEVLAAGESGPRDGDVGRYEEE